jgi:uncharacterized protein YlxP (DUF503 family)
VTESGFVAVLVVDLHFPEAGGLKSKRKELSSIKAQLRTRLGAAVSEVAFQDLWQRARLTVALTGGALNALDAAADNLERWLLARWPEHVHIQRIVASVDDLVDLAGRDPLQVRVADLQGESVHTPGVRG